MSRDSIPAREPLRLAALLRVTRALLLAVAVSASAFAAPTDSSRMPSAREGVVETGAPSFAVLGSEAIGLSGPPTDLQLLPDGRILAVSRSEIAFGDGVRWRVFRAAENETPVSGRVALDADGRIYFGIEGGIARLEISPDARWRTTKLADLPAGFGLEVATMISVTTLANNWYWTGGSGSIVAWQPGERPRIAGQISSVERIFELDGELFASDQSSGGLYRLTAAGAEVERLGPAAHFASDTVTCMVPFAPGVALVGTSYAGLRLFDGNTFQTFGQPGLLNEGVRINDLCAAGDHLFAAAVDTVGVVFFDRAGRIVQLVGRSLDHRLGRAQKVLYSNSGVLWALLNDGIARIEFPSPVSWLEPLIPSGLVFAQPVRHEGKLWLLTDGRAMRGVYDASHRLAGFEKDDPGGRYVFTLTVTDQQLFATNETGIYVRRDEAWTLVASGVVNARVIGTLPGGRLLYAARDEFGVLEPMTDGYSVQRKPVPQLGDVYGATEDAAGVVWLELGMSRVARLDPRPAQPTLDVFGPADGLTDGWVEIFAFEGVARFHLASQLFRFDDQTRRFVADQPLLDRYPQLLIAHGRPVADPAGHLWYTIAGAPHMLHTKGPEAGTVRIVPVGFAPSNYTVEDNGVVWMFLNRRLARVDLRMPATTPSLPQAIVTDVHFPAANRHVFKPAETLGTIAYADSSLVFHFAAPANPFGPALTFEVLLEGAGSQWISTGNVGSAAFNRLKEGNYAFRVRPVLTGSETGAEARIAFVVRPPWFRTPLAWAVYGVSALGLFGFAAWFSAFIQRRDNERLERLVGRRTEELNASNQQLGRQIQETTEKSTALAASEERYRLLNTQLEQRVRERTAELSLSNEELQQRESLFRLIFEHAPVGISWKRSDLGDVYHLNPTFRRILALPHDAPTDHTLLEKLVHPEDAPRLQRMNRQIGSGETDSYNIEQRFVLPAGTVVWTSLSVAVVRDPRGRIVQDIGILEDITSRKQAEQELTTTYKNLVEASRMAGMAEVATGVLHNVGNVLNSLNVSANLLANGIRQSKVDSLVKLSALLDARAGDLGVFLTQDPKGRLVPEMLAKLAGHSVAERDWLVKEVSSMQKNIDHIKEIVAMQQSYATMLGVVETLDASTLFEDALRMNTAALMRHDVTVVREYLPVPRVSVEKGKILQILINLIRNAKYACDDANLPEGTQKILTVRIEPGDAGQVRLIVRDNGVGIAPENLTRIFAHGFTTRAYGHGFGLHSSAVAAKEMKGSLTAHSDGLGCGATFVLEIPVEHKKGENTGAVRSIPPVVA